MARTEAHARPALGEIEVHSIPHHSSRNQRTSSDDCQSLMAWKRSANRTAGAQKYLIGNSPNHSLFGCGFDGSGTDQGFNPAGSGLSVELLRISALCLLAMRILWPGMVLGGSFHRCRTVVPWPANFHGHVDNHFHPDHGYHRPTPARGEAAGHGWDGHAEHFHGNEVHDGHDHRVGKHSARARFRRSGTTLAELINAREAGRLDPPGTWRRSKPRCQRSSGTRLEELESAFALRPEPIPQHKGGMKVLDDLIDIAVSIPRGVLQ
jgi:hypothetical protein